ncbi:MAG TPA: hypothetical protein VFM54_20050 [Micromonosporaceae bacterium]|nr:hypothetical protein [Micromonosporaceae bacterium]
MTADTFPLVSRAAVTWRYLHRGKVRHALGIEGYAITGHAQRAACGLRPDWCEDWMGTGSQREYDRAAGLPECTRCAARVKPAEVVA